MNRTLKIGLLLILIELAVIAVLAFPTIGKSSDQASMTELLQWVTSRQTPRAPAQAFTYSIFRTAPLEVAKVFGRTQGCSDADADLINSTARAAIDAGLDPAIAAATIGVESGCNQFAVSSRGAIGIMQIVPKVWKDKFDFAGDVNLLNRETNIRVGATIEAGLINQYGMTAGVQRYNGLGVGCDTCDAGYASKILALAGRRGDDHARHNSLGAGGPFGSHRPLPQTGHHFVLSLAPHV